MADFKAVVTDKAFPPAGPYSQAIQIPIQTFLPPTTTSSSTTSPPSSLLFLSGQIPALPTGALVTGSITAQTAACIANIRAILEAAGSSLDRVVKVNAFLTDMGHFKEFNAEYERGFGGEGGEEREGKGKQGRVLPARSCVAVKALPLGVDVEIECVALV